MIKALEDGEDTGLPLDEDTVKGRYPTGKDMILGLKAFIEFDDREERKKLVHSDFVVIMDRILKFKSPLLRPEKKGREGQSLPAGQ